MASYRIHNIRFYSPEPKSATCLCHEPKTKKLALARNDNSIEIWNVENAPFVECTIAAHAENSVESILWIGPRLFSTGLQGAVIEYDLLTLGSKYKVMVIGAGVDGYLAVSSYPPKNLVKYPPLLQSPCATICRKSRCILLRYTNYLELWRLGSITKDPPELIRSSMLHQLDEEPIKLLQLQAKGDESIISCAINKDSKTIVYSTDTHVRVFNFDVIEGDALLSRNDADLSMNRVQKMLFSPNGKLFITINNDGDENTVTLFRVDKKSLRLIGSFNTTKESITNVGLVCFSPDNKYLIFTDRQCGIAVYFIGNGITAESLKSWRLPKYSCPATAIAVQKGTLNLVVVYSDHKIIEYNIPTRQYTMFSNSLQNYLPKHWLARPFPITNIIFDPHNENIIIMQDDSSVYVINKNSELPEKEAKIPKRENGENTEDSNSISSSQSQHAFQVAKKYKHLVYLNWLNDEELIAVEVNPTSLSEKLPPTLKQKFFGM
ncbi:Cirhin [Camponotus floridanus]|uniref:Cirhin n=1 Tax=Camponotus floridanus TaxID=104421 RepID=E2AT10_CAMFO|nr:Cirhin [Camponotus floridanus]